MSKKEYFTYSLAPKSQFELIAPQGGWQLAELSYACLLYWSEFFIGEKRSTSFKRREPEC